MDAGVCRAADALNWTGYIYGGLAHSCHVQYDEKSETKGEASVCRGLARMGLNVKAVAGRRVMDVGTGLYGLGFHRLGAIVEHHDISLRTVHALNTYARMHGYTNLESFHTNLVSDPLPQEHFDLIYLSGVFQHFETPDRALVNLCKALKVGGYLYIDIYRSGRWRWFVVDVMRKILDKSLLQQVIERFTDSCALGRRNSFDLRQVELLVDDMFVDHLHLFHPDDLTIDAAALSLELMSPITSMDLVDASNRVDLSLYYAHVFNTLIFRKSGVTDASRCTGRTGAGRCQVAELEAMSGSYGDLVNLTAEFILAHRGGTFSRDAVVSHVVNLFRMAHPCFPSDPYLELGVKESAEAKTVMGNEDTLKRRLSLWCTFLSNVMNVHNPFDQFGLESLGYELVRFLPQSQELS